MWSSLSKDQFVLRDYDKKIVNMSSVKNIFRRYKKDLLVSHLRDFVSCCKPNRMVGTVSHAKVAPWLISKIKEIDPTSLLFVDEFTPDIDHGISLYEKDFQKEIAGNYSKDSDTYKKWNNFTNSMVSQMNKLRSVKGKNIIWEKKGTINSKEVIVLGAHYDTIAFNKKNLNIDFNSNQPGADNNGSGVAILLSLIEVLSEVDLPKTVRIVFFDFQEFGFLGSRAFVQKYKSSLKEEKFAGFVNLLMLGNDTKRNDKSKRYNNFKIYIRSEKNPLHGKDLKLVKSLKRAGDKAASGMKFDVVSSGFNSGDHINFWEESFPALTFTQNWEDDFNAKRHHTSNDFVETLNFKSLYNSFRYIGPSVLAWAYDIF
jgi:Zn-dependent M28 family amino/carboxypeptidase